MPLGQFDERVPVALSVALDNSTPTGTGQSFGGNVPNGSWRMDVWQASNTDVIDHNLIIAVNQSGDIILGEVRVPSGAGTGTTPPVDILGQLLPTGFHYATLGDGVDPGYTLVESITAGKFVYLTILGGSF